MSALTSKFITRPRKVNGFAGAGTQVAVGEHAFWIVAADEQTLRELVAELLPKIDPTTLNIHQLTIIQSRPNE
jgi:hypothetical protein